MTAVDLSDLDRAGLEAAYEEAVLGLSEGGIPIGSALVVDGQGVTVEVASLLAPPPREDLSSLLEVALGEQIPVQVSWRDLSAEAAEAEQARLSLIESSSI